MKKEKKFSIKKILIGLLAFLGVGFIISAGLIFYFITQVDYKYTGEELFNAVNQHRTYVGVQELQIDENLCDNLVERWLAIREPNNGHKGFEEWLETEGIAEGGILANYDLVGELYVKDISTPENAINWWLGSPGHKSTLEKEELNVGCAYASDGTGVVVVGATKELN
jgi:hypothetical protein